MIASQDAKTPAINGNRNVKAKFGGKIGDLGLRKCRALSLEPRAFRPHVAVEGFQNSRILSDERRIMREGGETVRLELLKQLYGVVLRQMPQCWVQCFKESSRFR